MVPSIKNYAENGKKLYIGKILVEGYSALSKIVNSRLDKVGAEIEVSVDTASEKGGYELLIDEGIEIKASESLVAAAFSTLITLIGDDCGKSYLPKISVCSSPKYDYRGVMLDVSRHFFGCDEVKKLLDVMFMLKLNAFHFHLSDDQGFRLSLSDFPELERAAYRDYSVEGGYKNAVTVNSRHGGAYTEDEIKELIEYANARGIEVIPELDIPGHMTAILSAHSEFTCRGEDLEVLGRYGIIENVLCLGNDEAVSYVLRLLKAIIDLFKPKRFHLGFDEVKLTYVDSCEKCKAKMKKLGLKSSKELKSYMRAVFGDYVKSFGVTPIFWNDGMEKEDASCICQHWKPFTASKTAKMVNRGQKTIMSSFTYLYMDYPYAMTTLRRTYKYNPVLRGIKSPENVLGVEAPLWTEWVRDHDKIAFNAYYRLAATAEIGWNGEKRQSYEDFFSYVNKNEELLFGEKLSIREEDVNPKRRISALKKYASDAYSEVMAWSAAKGKKTNLNDKG